MSALQVALHCIGNFSEVRYGKTYPASGSCWIFKSGGFVLHNEAVASFGVEVSCYRSGDGSNALNGLKKSKRRAYARAYIA